MRKIYLVFVLFLFAITTKLSAQVTVSGSTGANGAYTSLTQAGGAFATLNAAGSQAGNNILITISADVATEDGSYQLNGNGWTTLTINPTGGAARVVSGAVNGPLISLNAATNVTINGLNAGGNALTISNTSTGSSASTIRFINDASSNTVTKCTLLGSTGAAVSGFGIVYFATGVTTGNDNNTISQCNLSASAGGSPLNAIYSLGTSAAIDNSGNTITINNIADYFNAGLSTAGMNINTGNSGWTITNNAFYQTATRTYTSSGTHYGIQITSGSGYTISNNVIGFANPAATGTTNMIGLTSGSLGGTFPSSYTTGGVANATRYVAINCAFTTGGAASSIQNNTIGGFALYTSSGAATTNGIFCGIAVTSGNVNIGTVTGNTIGATSGTGSIYTACTTSGGMAAGIYVTSANTVNISNNTVGAIDAMGTTATICGGIHGISVAGSGNFNIYGNTIGNSTAPNLRMGNLTTAGNLSNVGSTFGTASGIGIFRGIQNTSTATLNIGSLALPNIIRNAQLNSTSATAGTAILRGIDCNSGNAGVPTISYNTISNLSAAVTNVTFTSGSVAAVGIYLSQVVTPVVSNNTISGLNLTNVGAGGYNLAGISFTAINGSISVTKNKIYDLGNASTSVSTTAPGTATGIFIRDGSGAATDISNNMISLGNSRTTNTAFIGIWAQYGLAVATTGKIYHNTINIEGTAAAGAQPSFGFLRGDLSATANTVFTVDMKNCIITNSRTGGTGKHYALANSYGATASATGWATNASNYNLLNATAATVGYWSADRTFAAWKTASASDANSLSGYTATFTNSATGDLHINMGVTPNVIESGGTTGLGIAVDYDNDARPGPAGSVNGGAIAPDLGADEFDGVILDVVAPTITYTPLLNAVCTSNRTFTATVTDISGVNNTIGTRPRVYYKRSTDGNVWNDNTSGTDGWKFAEASNGANPFSLTIDYSLLNGGGGVSTGQTVQYFVVAQDLATTPNVGINSGVFAVTPSTVALTGTAFALTGSINSYNIVSAIPTVVTIGVAGTYTSLTGAAGLFADLNAKGLSGNTVATIIDASVTETGANALSQMATDCSGLAYTLTIKPSAAGTVLTGTLASGALIKIKSSNVIIDGSSNGTNSRDLTITNLSVTSPQVLLIGSTGTVPVSNTTVKNSILINGINSSTAVVVSDGTTAGSAGYFTNITLQNNSIQKSYIGVYSIAVVSSGNGSGLNISSNSLNTSGANAIRNIGLYVQGVDGATLADNDIGNFETTTGEIDRGIWFATGTTNSVIERNKIHDLQYTGTSGYGTKGVSISTGLAAANITIRNNMISGMTGDGDSYLSFGGTYSPVGIYVFGIGQGGINIYYNSINLYGATLNFAADSYSLGIALDNNSSASIKNNIIRNTLGLLAANGTGAGGIGAFTSASQFTALDYNDYYIAPAAGGAFIGNITNTFLGGLAAWQGFTGKDPNSLNVQPNFTSTSDLHLVATNNCGLDGYGTPIAGITTDYDVQTRDVTTPDMGADEFIATYSGTLAGVAGSATCENKNVSLLGTTYATSSCDLIAKVLPSGGTPVSGKIKTCVTLDAAQQFFNAEPYVQRHYDIEPLTANTTTTSATITLYFTDAEFALFNTNNPGWPALPTVAGGGNADPNRANLKVTQYHGTPTTTPSTPGNYSANAGKGVYIDPADANIVWNGSYWAVTFDVTGFSGFYVHTNIRYALPITVNYFRGTKQGSNHLLDWKVTCNTTPRVTMTLERSASASGPFAAINSLTADAVRCNQPFSYTDAQPLKGMNYYRLKMVDADGKISYSSIVALLNATKGYEFVNIVPNPVTANGVFKLNVSSAQVAKMDIVISDMQGRVVNRQTLSLIAGFNSIDMNVANLAAGTYNISGITPDDKSRVIRFVKQ